MATKVSESTGYTSNLEMSVVGYAIGAVLVILMLPLLPVVALAYIVWRAFFANEPAESSFQEWRSETGRPRNSS